MENNELKLYEDIISLSYLNSGTFYLEGVKEN